MNSRRLTLSSSISTDGIRVSDVTSSAKAFAASQ
jgi:hypothetical protein